MVKNLFAELDTSQVVAAQLVTTQLEADELLRSVVAAFGLPFEEAGKAALLRHFEDFFARSRPTRAAGTAGGGRSAESAGSFPGGTADAVEFSGGRYPVVAKFSAGTGGVSSDLAGP
ncbi:hypothetical protein [Candidatus Competibacter phosphatis]|uniref:hypothetical protein n=1 Tax=Candidatus Competibacter phosphatis TaxID=221280 RepID=UPI002483BEA1|nr:hypothetical protein [Candidatus Competibacter phosphatis]